MTRRSKAPNYTVVRAVPGPQGRLLDARRANLHTGEFVAKLFGISQATLSRIERGVTPASLEVLDMIAEYVERTDRRERSGSRAQLRALVAGEMKLAKLGTRALAKCIGTSHATVSRFLNGHEVKGSVVEGMQAWLVSRGVKSGRGEVLP